jgi:hypothetical protein
MGRAARTTVGMATIERRPCRRNPAAGGRFGRGAQPPSEV